MGRLYAEVDAGEVELDVDRADLVPPFEAAVGSCSGRYVGLIYVSVLTAFRDGRKIFWGDRHHVDKASEDYCRYLRMLMFAKLSVRPRMVTRSP